MKMRKSTREEIKRNLEGYREFNSKPSKNDLIHVLVDLEVTAVNLLFDGILQIQTWKEMTLNIALEVINGLSANDITPHALGVYHIWWD